MGQKFENAPSKHWIDDVARMNEALTKEGFEFGFVLHLETAVSREWHPREVTLGKPCRDLMQRNKHQFKLDVCFSMRLVTRTPTRNTNTYSTLDGSQTLLIYSDYKVPMWVVGHLLRCEHGTCMLAYICKL